MKFSEDNQLPKKNKSKMNIKATVFFYLKNLILCPVGYWICYFDYMYITRMIKK